MLEVDHIVRYIQRLTEELFGPELRSDVSLQGGFGYDPVDLLGVWIYAFMQGELSTRRLEEHCRYDARFQFLVKSCKPDHSTLSRFRKSLGSRMDDLMVRFCITAGELGILQRKTMVVDGTKAAALRSQWARARKKADEVEDFEATASTMISHGQHIVGYNVQMAADADSGLVMAYVVTTDANDLNQLQPVCEAVKRQSGGLSERVVCDKGYDSSSNALALDKAGVEGYLPAKHRKQTGPFDLDESGDMVCRAGHKATKREWIDKKCGTRYHVFRVSTCSKCPLQDSCPGKGHQR